jgi:hypothetical protein
MSTTVAQAIKVLEEQTSDDPALAEAVVFMAEEAEGPTDPFDDVTPGVLGVARVVNRRRLDERQDEATRSALDTPEVVALLRSVNDRKGVDRRRSRGQLLAWKVGGRAYHPAWQFDRRRGDTRPGLPALVGALAEVASDPHAMDALMRAPRDDLGGRTLADLFAAGRLDTVLRLVRASAEQA